jgi:imidazolonepropionase-like amidohydrolase
MKTASVVLFSASLTACAGPPGDPTATGAGTSDSTNSTGANSTVSTSASTDAPTGEPTGANTGSPSDLAPPGTLLLRGGSIAGVGPADVRIAGATITEVGALEPQPGETVVDVTGRWLAPAFIDSHVHFAYLPGAPQMAQGGIAAAVDLAAPVAAIASDQSPLHVLFSGPMITAELGYPTQSWGAGGFGLECADAAAAVAAVDQLFDLGARVIKLPVTTGPQLDDVALATAAARAHELELPVVSHALGDDEAARAGAAGADVLAHTPTSPLTAATLDAWSGRAVISTLNAFGGGAAAVDNLAALRDRGATILYGTDYGNSSVPAIDAGELALLAQAGLTPAEVLAAGTAVPAAFWGFDELGSLQPGKAASLLILATDPLQDPATLAAPTDVLIAGVFQE